MIRSEFIDYVDDNLDLEGFVAISSDAKKLPLVILCHAYAGRDSFIIEKSKLISTWGYAGFALDMYGKGVLGKSREENLALKQPFIDDRKKLQSRVLKGFEVAHRLPYVDTSRIAIVGFGFGGICALDLARSGVDLKGAVSVYGHFTPPPASLIQPIKAKILILHGYKDPITPLDELQAFEKELDAAQVDWQTHLFGNAMHAFVNHSANNPELGITYHPLSDKRNWPIIKSFLEEIFQ